MNSIIGRKEQLVGDYTDVVYAQFMSIRYGINCGAIKDLILKKSLNDIVMWQSQLEGDITNLVDITLISDLPLIDAPAPFTIGGLNQKNLTKVHFKYELGNNQIVVDTDGCSTDITIIPNANGEYEFTQNVPSTIWIINHNLGFHPNVRIEDPTGVNLHGVITDDVSDPGNRLTIMFSLPYSGKAYLS